MGLTYRDRPIRAESGTSIAGTRKFETGASAALADIWTMTAEEPKDHKYVERGLFEIEAN